MTIDSSDDNLLQKIVRFSRLPWYWFTLIFTLILIVFLILAAFLEGAIDSFGDLDFWRQYIGVPALLAYILVIYPYMWRLSESATDALRKLLCDDEIEKGDVNTSVSRLRWEWTAIAIGAAFWILVQRPWGWDWGADTRWLNLYALVTFTLLFALLGWLIYYAITESRYLDRLSRRKLKLDIFDTSALIPVARSSLGTSFAFIGGISLSLVFQTADSLLVWSNITIYAVLVLATLFIFFFSMWSTHSTMARTKHNELALVRENLENAVRRLKDTSAAENSGDLNSLHSTVAAWGTYERLVREAREWPFNANILRRLVASTMVPAVVYLLKIFLGVKIFG
jgi:hypothetical protein